jgi:hypothetical protein
MAGQMRRWRGAGNREGSTLRAAGWWSCMLLALCAAASPGCGGGAGAKAGPEPDLPGKATLQWDRPLTYLDGATPMGSGIEGFRIYYGTSPGLDDPSMVQVGDTTSGVVDGLPSGREYYFSVTTLATNGRESAFSSEVSVFVNPGP